MPIAITRPCSTLARTAAIAASLAVAAAAPLAAQAPAAGSTAPAPRAASRPAVAQLKSGPMVGYSEMREVALWVQTTGAARVQIVYWDTLAPGRRYTTAETLTSARAGFTATLIADSVSPGRGYAYELRLDGKVVPRPYPLRFQAQALWQYRTDPPPFTLAFASCFYVNDAPYDRPGTPYGSEYGILTHLAKARPDAMVWLGDNTYTREADFYSRTGILYRYGHTRALAELQPVLGATHHYAIWDDHDYGPNDSDRSYRDAVMALDVFNLFWPNPPGRPLGKGITTMFTWQDVDVFLLDDRTWRTPLLQEVARREMLGRQQVDWLIEALSASHAPFRIVAIGSQVLNPVARFETYASYPAERDYLLERLAKEKIPGVIFVTGDRHFTELAKLERPGLYPLYDLTVSPLTAGTSDTWKGDANTLRVPGTLVQAHNFALLDVAGPRTDRTLTFRVVDAEGTERWRQQVRARDLQVPGGRAGD